MYFSFVPKSAKTAVTAAIAHLLVYPLCADGVKETQGVLSEWISVEKQISEDRSEWVAQKEVLLNSIDFMKGAIDQLDESIKTAKETSSAGEKKRAELVDKKEELDAVTAKMKTAVSGYEAKIRSLSKTWPEAFIDSVDTFLKRIPDAVKADTAPLTIRLQNVVAIMSQFDKFQSVITKETGVQDIEGESREVTTLYYGFAYAYFVDGSGEYAGYGYPTESGWDWVSEPSLAEDISQLVAIHEGGVEAAFIGLPAKIVTP